jgi:hypothetical protein
MKQPEPLTLPQEAADIWELEYQKRVRADVEEGRISQPLPNDRRRQPRLRLELGKNIWIHTERSSVPILDLSAGGIAFHSDTRQFVGDRVSLNVADTVAIEAIVVDCTLEETDPQFLEFKYLVRAKYAPGVNGFRVYVLARDIYIYNLERSLDLAVAN